MNQEKNLNPQVVHDAAAFLFWTLADAVGVAGANESVIDSAGQCLLEQSFTAEVLGQYAIEKFPRNIQHEFHRAVAAEAERFAVGGTNMNGVIYGEDAQAGKAPSAQHVNTVQLRVIPKRFSMDGAKIERIGRLCLRHPLPAVVFSETRPHGDVLEVSDTSAALGFFLPMFLTSIATSELGDHLFASTGIFHIPAPDVPRGHLWDAAIQNSTRFSEAITFYGESGTTVVNVEW